VGEKRRPHPKKQLLKFGGIKTSVEKKGILENSAGGQIPKDLESKENPKGRDGRKERGDYSMTIRGGGGKKEKGSSCPLNDSDRSPSE